MQINKNTKIKKNTKQNNQTATAKKNLNNKKLEKLIKKYDENLSRILNKK
ncbi:hypothetical protein N4239_08160 [Brachyspira hyodysenteriae]|nr:hypothetical protein [Brachyspira hyodysenteriae]WPC22914.1 hypothetical protein N4239_08160 [Brachyspira hyodysenteriae]